MAPEQVYRDILVIDLLGGIGDLLMLLPAIHGLARRNPDANMRVVTHEPGAELIRGDPAVTEVRVPRHPGPGAEREAVRDALAARRPDLGVTTTRYDGIPQLVDEYARRSVTDLWRDPPPDELVSRRYLRILHAEGLLDAADLEAAPRVHLSHAELVQGGDVVTGLLPPDPQRPPVVLVTEAGMAVKRWPWRHWCLLALTLARRGHPVLALPPVPAPPAVALPRVGLRQLAATFAAVARRGGIVVGADTGPTRLAAAAGAATVALFGPTTAARYGLSAGADRQGLSSCPHRRPLAITDQPCWWTGQCPLSGDGPACMADLRPESIADVVAQLTRPAGTQAA